MMSASASDRLFMGMTAAAALIAAVVSLTTPMLGDPVLPGPVASASSLAPDVGVHP